MTGLARKLTRAGYLLRRLCESPPSFLARKAAIELRKRVDRGRVLHSVASGDRFSEEYEERLPELRHAAGEIRRDVLAELRALELGGEELIEALAGEFDAGRWSCLGYGYYPLREGAWQEDDFHGRRWRPEYFAAIDFACPDRRCDVKVPWEKSRLQWLPGVALASCLDGDQVRRNERLERAHALLLDWIERNPYGVGVNWVSAMEVAIRGVNLLTAIVFLEEHLTGAELRFLLIAVGEHQRYLRRFPETSDVQGNHYLATELGSYFLAELGGGARSSERVAETFLSVCEEQFTSEGLHVEYSPAYHRLSLEMVVIGRGLMKRARPELAARLDPLIHRGVRACRLLANARGELPIMSDNDGGKVLDFGQASRRFGAFASITAWPEVEPLTTSGERILGAVLAGLGGGAPPLEAVAGEPEELALLPPFIVWTGARDKLVIRAGELGLAGRASHDHDDALSFWYSADGHDAIVEAGSPPYTRDLEERARAISSEAHNVIAAAGSKRFEPGVGSVCATLRGGPRGTARILEEESGPVVETTLLAGDPTRSSGSPSEHTRRFRRDGAASLLIEDRFRFQGARAFELRLHFPVGARLQRTDHTDSAVLVELNELSLRIAFAASVDLSIATDTYAFHPEYGTVHEAPVLILRGIAAEEVELRTQLEPGAGRRHAC